MLHCSSVTYACAKQADHCQHFLKQDATPCRLLEVQDFLEADEVEEYTNRSTSLGLETMELQWTSYVNNLKASGCLSNALAVCDVSGSMSGQPMEVSPVLLIMPLHVVASCCCVNIGKHVVAMRSMSA